MTRELRRALLYSVSTPQRQRSRPTPKPKPCPCGCGTPGMCARHRERLAAVREGMAGGDGAYKKRWKENRKRKSPVCCAAGCWEPRVPPAAFCALCQARGMVEEDLGWEESE